MGILSTLRKLTRNSLTLTGAFYSFARDLFLTFLDGLALKWRKRIFIFLKLLFVFNVALLAGSTALQSLGRSVYFSEFKAVWGQNEAAALDNKAFPGGRVVKWVRDRLPDDAKLLIYRQAEFAYYVHKNWIYDFDPKIIDLYDIKEKKDAYRYILNHGITHIFVPNYMTATLYNSAMIDVIGDPSLTRELTSHAGMRLFEVFPKPRAWTCGAQNTNNNWVQGIIGPRITFEANGAGLFGPSAQGAAPKTFVRFREKGGVFSRRFTKPFGAMEVGDEQMLLVWPFDYHEPWSPGLKGRIGLLSGYGPLYLAPGKSFPAKAVNTIHMSFEVEGDGILEVWLYQYDANGGFSMRRVWDAVLVKNKGIRDLSIQARTQSDTVSYRIMVNNSGSAKGHARVKGLSNCSVQYGWASASEDTGSQMLADGRTHLNTIRTKVIKSWDLQPVTSREQLGKEGIRMQLGTDCANLGWLCRTLHMDGPSGRLLVHPKKSGGVSIKMPIAAGFTIFTNSPVRSLRTHWQCRIGRLVWFAARSPGRRGKLSRFYLWLLRSQLPELKDPNAPRVNLEVALQTSPNTTINTSLLWRDGKGRKNCTYLGEKAMESASEKLVWNFPFPKDAHGINLAITTNHGLNEFMNMQIDQARITVPETAENLNHTSGLQ